MNYVFNEFGEKVLIKNGVRNKDYICPICNQKVFLSGRFSKNYIYHYKDYPCTLIPYFYEKEGKIFLTYFKNLFPEENQDIVLNDVKTNKNILVDVLVDEKALRFIPLTYKKKNFDLEKKILLKKAKELIYIIYIENEIEKGMVELNEYTNSNQLYFHHCDNDFKDMLDLINDKTINNFSLYFLISSTFKNKTNAIKSEGYVPYKRNLLIKATESKQYNKNNYSVKTTKIIEIEDFLKEFKVKFIPTFISQNNLYDELRYVYTDEESDIYYGCPLSKTHLCSTSKVENEEIREMRNCKDGCSPYYPFCNKRIESLKINENVKITKVCRTRTGLITYIEGLDNNKIVKFIPKSLKSFENNISKDLFKVFYNIEKGYYIKLISNDKCKISKNLKKINEGKEIALERVNKENIYLEIKNI